MLLNIFQAPELFDPEHAWQALEQAKNKLFAPNSLGMKTLDPDCKAYSRSYNNNEDSDNKMTAKGASYHQGPEWVWPVGYYLRARLHFAQKTNRLPETIAETWTVLSKLWAEIEQSQWRGLVELTNHDGNKSEHSCNTQAWSMATILETVYDLSKLNGTK